MVRYNYLVPIVAKPCFTFSYLGVSFIDFLKENYEGKKILVVTHAGVIYAFQRVLNLKVEGVNNLDIVKIKI